MKLFMIDAYGGPEATDGAIHHFAVQADSAEEALELVKLSEKGHQFARFDVSEADLEVEGEEAEIIREIEEPHSKAE